jgi:hypothetical protein
MRRKHRIRGAVAASWATINPILGKYEMGYEADTYKLKIGDGVTQWDDLEYFSGGSSGSFPNVAFVAPLGSNTEGELGNPGKPYLTPSYAQQVAGANTVVIYPGLYNDTLTGVNNQRIFMFPGVRISHAVDALLVTTAVTMQVHGYGIFEGPITVNHVSANVSVTCARINTSFPFGLRNGRLKLTVQEDIQATADGLLQNASVLDLTVFGNWTCTVPAGRTNNKFLYISSLNHTEPSIIRAKRISIINAAATSASETYKGLWVQNSANGRVHIYCQEIANDRDYTGAIPTAWYDAALHIQTLGELIVHGNVKSQIDYGVQVINGDSNVTINGNIESAKNIAVLLTSSAGTRLTVNGDITGHGTAPVHAGKMGFFAWNGAGKFILNGKVISKFNDPAGHGIVKYPGCSVILRENAGFYLTHAAASPVSSSDASVQTIKIQKSKVFSNGTADANITNSLSAGEIIMDTNVEY